MDKRKETTVTVSIVLYQKVSKSSDDALVKDHPSKPQFTVYE